MYMCMYMNVCVHVSRYGNWDAAANLSCNSLSSTKLVDGLQATLINIYDRERKLHKSSLILN